MNIQTTPFPEITTERLVLRRLVIADKERLSEMRSDKAVNKYLNRPEYTNLEEAEAFIKRIDGHLDNNESFYWVLSFANNNEFIGTICLWNFDLERGMADLGYELMPEYQGQGFMLEAAEKVIEYGFDAVGLKIITGLTHPENKASQRLLERMGFKADKDYSYVNKEEAGEESVFYLLKP